MSAREATGFLMRESWRADVVLARKIELRGDHLAPGTVRAWCGEWLGAHLGGDDLIDVMVLVSELITNAVRHSGAGEHATVVVHLAIAPHVLRVEVCDQGPGFEAPAVPRPHPQGGGGNGLVLLSRLSSNWGVACDDGTCVWFERALSPPAPA